MNYQMILAKYLKNNYKIIQQYNQKIKKKELDNKYYNYKMLEIEMVDQILKKKID